MAKGTSSRTPEITVMHVPPIAMADVTV